MMKNIGMGALEEKKRLRESSIGVNWGDR